MDIWEQDKLILFIAFVIPGFVSLKAYELLFPSQRTDSSTQIIEAVTYSCINYALLFWLIVLAEDRGLKEFSKSLYVFFILYFYTIYRSNNMGIDLEKN